MGSNSSTRRISVPNDGSSITVSKAVADRLQCPPSSTAKDKEKDKAEVKPEVSTTTAPPKSLSGQQKIGHEISLNIPSLTTLQVLQAKEQELQENDKYWATRVAKAEEEHQYIGEAFEKEYQRALKEMPLPSPPKPAPCQQTKQGVLDCYKKNSNEILLCAKVVSEFSQCIEGKHIA